MSAANGVEGSVKIRALMVAAAALAFAAFLLLGLAVNRYGEPSVLWAFDRALVGHAVRAAWDLTQLGRFYALAILVVVLIGVAIGSGFWRSRIVFSIIMLLLSWRAADFFQHVFARPRRLDWFVFHETSFSYPSSHAAIAVAFYGLWAWLLWRNGSLPRRWVGAGLAVVAIAICWSRLALGAHYVTDVAGGALLGAALLAGGAAVWPEIALPRRREPA